jgi:hypothetical protein
MFKMKLLPNILSVLICFVALTLLSFNMDGRLKKVEKEIEQPEEVYKAPASMPAPLPAEPPVVPPNPELKAMDRAILEVLKADPRRDLNKDEKKRQALAKVLLQVGGDYNIDPYLILAMAFKEGSLRTNAIGKLGEVSTMQVHGVAKKRCLKEGFILSTLAGQIECGVFYLTTLIADCGGLRCGLNGYASGSYDVNEEVRHLVDSRLALAHELRNLK